MSIRTALIAAAALLVVLAVAVGARMAVWSGHDQATGGQAAIGGPFSLVDHTGKAVTEAEYRGKFTLIYFGYTFCPDVCPTELGVMAAAYDKLTLLEQSKLQPLFITVDPARDTVAVMKDYVAAFHPKLIGLTGSEEQVAQAAKAYKVYAAKAKGDDPKSYTMDHSSILYLMGRDGKFIAHFPHGTTADELAAGLKKHLQ